MYKLPKKSELKKLQSFKDGLCASLYMTCEGIECTPRAARIKLKNELREVERLLEINGADKAAVHVWTDDVRSLLDTDILMTVQDTAQVLFMHPNFFRWYQIPSEGIEDVIAIQDGFYLDYITAAMNKNRNYFVLLLGHKDIRLLAGDNYSIKSLDLGEFKTDMKEALLIDEFPRSTEAHMIAPAGHPGSEGMHSQYDASKVDKLMLDKFFRKLDKHIQKKLRKENYPLILAGVKYLLPMYEKVNTYPNILSSHIVGNQSHTDPQEIKNKALAVLST